MSRHGHSRRPSEERDYAPVPSSRALPYPTAEQTQLPSLAEAIPEISWTHPSTANIADYRRVLNHNPQGPASYHTTSPLGSPPLPSSRSMTRPTLEIPAPTPTGSTRRLPIHSGPTNRNSGSSSSSDLSSNRRTTNTSPSISPIVPPPSSSSRAGAPERTRQVKVEAPPTPGLSPSVSSPYGSYPSHVQPSSRYGSYGYEKPQPYQPAPLSYTPSVSATTPAPAYKVEAPRYAGYPMPPEVPGYPAPPCPPLYIDNFQPADGERRSKKRRGNLPKWQTDLMRAWFNAHANNPYPTEEEKHMIMRETGLTIEQVANWFINCRRRHGPEITRQAQAESNLRRAHGGSSQGSTRESPTRRREPVKSEPR